MPDNAVSAWLSEIRRLLGRDMRSDSRYEAVKLMAFGGPQAQVDVARGLALSAPAAKELLEKLRDDGFIEIDTSGSRPRYSATQAGIRIVTAIEAVVLGAVCADLVRHVLVCASRPPENTRGLRDAMLENTLSLFSGYGSFLYVGVCPDDPELVAELLGRIEASGAEASSFRAASFVDRTTQ